jgi:hypothetical protein
MCFIRAQRLGEYPGPAQLFIPVHRCSQFGGTFAAAMLCVMNVAHHARGQRPELLIFVLIVSIRACAPLQRAITRAIVSLSQIRRSYCPSAGPAKRSQWFLHICSTSFPFPVFSAFKILRWLSIDFFSTPGREWRAFRSRGYWNIRA